MSRAVPEWIGKDENEAVPARVKVRIFDRCNGRCCACGVAIVGRTRPAFDHVDAIVNGGSNRESNLQLLCVGCHAAKTKCDVAEKAVLYRKRLKHLGLKPKGRPFPGSRASGFKKSFDGTVTRR